MMHLRIAKLKMTMNRLASYTAVPTFLLLVFFWMDRFYDAWFTWMNYFAFMLGTGILILGAGFILYRIDAKVWEQENAIISGATPLTVTEAFRSAKHLTELESEGLEVSIIETRLREIFEESKLGYEFDWFLRVIRSEKIESASRAVDMILA